MKLTSLVPPASQVIPYSRAPTSFLAMSSTEPQVAARGAIKAFQ
jgi:hypothetical protein